MSKIMERDSKILDEIFGILSSDFERKSGNDSHSQRMDILVKHNENDKTIKTELTNFKGNKKEYKCSECGKQYTNYNGWYRHKQSHSPSEKSCDVCGKCYTSKIGLSAHLLTHTRPHTCRFCGKTFATLWLLDVHLNLHTGEKPYACQQCDKEFADPSNLRAHLRSHSGLKHYQCDVCSKLFANKQNVTVHLRSHSGEKPYTCGKCSKKFSDPSTYRRHLVRMHKFKSSKRKQASKLKMNKKLDLIFESEKFDVAKYSPEGRSGGDSNDSNHTFSNNSESTLNYDESKDFTEGTILVKTEAELIIA